MKNGGDDSTSVRAVENSLDILELLLERRGAGVTEMATELGLSKSTVHNHLNTLEARNYVVRTRNGYDVGPHCVTLGGFVRDHHPLYRIAKPVVDSLAEETDELALITAPNAGRSMYIYQVRGSQAVTTDSYLGIRLPMHCTATGKAMLAHMEQSEVERVVREHGLPEQTEHTITEPDRLFDELDVVREQGYALDDEERILGMRGIASAVTHRDSGEVIGALSITGPTSRINGDTFTETIPTLVRRNARMLEVDATYSE